MTAVCARKGGPGSRVRVYTLVRVVVFPKECAVQKRLKYAGRRMQTGFSIRLRISL